MSATITDSFHELQPAYGRDYRNRKEVEVAFKSGQDFIGDMTMGFKPCSIRDFAVGSKQNLRYSKLTKVTVVTV